MNKKPKGKLMIIGGAERRNGGEPILEAVAQAAIKAKGSLAIITAATYSPEGTEEYVERFQALGVKQVDLLDIRAREDAFDEAKVRTCREAAVIFFTGGDQLRITSQLGDSPMFQCMQENYDEGGMIAGTSAGAAAMPETMIIGGPGDESNRISALSMAPGLGFLADAVIDSHFAQRGRMGRLLGAVAQNPRNLGIGIDESTAILVEREAHFTVLGEGAVYVVDGSAISYSSLSEKEAAGIVTIHNVNLHVLGENDCFDLVNRQPIVSEKAERATIEK
jgi:cyanophycinase